MVDFVRPYLKLSSTKMGIDLSRTWVAVLKELSRLEINKHIQRREFALCTTMICKCSYCILYKLFYDNMYSFSRCSFNVDLSR